MPNSTYKTVSLWIIKILVFLVPFIPLVIAKSLFFPYITGKAFLFRAIVEVTFALWVFLAIFYKEYRPRFNALTISIVVFLIVVSLATIFGINPERSFWSNFERMEGLVTYLHLAAYFLVLAHVFEKKDWILFFNLFVISGIFENFYVLLQKVGYLPSPQGGVRVDGTIGNSTYLAAYLIFVLGFAAVLLAHSKTLAGKIYYGAASLFGLMSIYFTATRGAMLALLIVGFLSAVTYLLLVKTDTARGRLQKKIGLYIVAAVALIPILFFLFRDAEFVTSSPVLRRFRSLSLDDARAYIWKMSYQGFTENPVLGWGPENYGTVFSKYYIPQLYSQEPWFDRAHNIVLDWLVNAGVPGLLSYFGMFAAAYYLIWSNFRKSRLTLEVALILSMLLLVYVLQNIFVFDNIATYLSFFTILAYIYNIAVFEDPLAEEGEVKKSRHFHYNSVFDLAYAPLAGALLALPLAYVFYTVNAKPFLANRALLEGIKTRTIQELDSGFEQFRRALSYDTLGNQEIREQLARFAEVAVLSPNVPDQKKLEIFKFAIDEANKSVEENPMDSRPLYFLSALMVRAQLLDEALMILAKAVELSPNKQQAYFEIGDIYLQKKEYGKAIEILEKAWKLEPSFMRARVNLMVALILAGRNEEADRHMREAYGPDAIDADPLLAKTYLAVGDYARLLRVREIYVKQQPDNWDYRKDVVDTLLKLGRWTEAVRYLETLIKERPNLALDAQTYLRQIR